MTTITEAALAAQQIRNILKKEFPETKFLVRTSKKRVFSIGDWIDIIWLDGVSINKVRELISCYEYIKHNTIKKTWEPSNKRDDIPQAAHIFLDRKENHMWQ